MSEPLPFCQKCHRMRPSHDVTYHEVLGAHGGFKWNLHTGFMCSSCARQKFWTTTLWSMTVGLIGIPGLVTGPIAAMRNIKARRDYLRRANAASSIGQQMSQPQTILRDAGSKVLIAQSGSEYPLKGFPWIPATEPQARQLNTINVNAPMALGIVCLLGVIFCGIMGVLTARDYFSGQYRGKPWIPPEEVVEQTWPWVVSTIPLFAIFLLGVFISIAWWKKRYSPSVAMDVLGHVFPAEVIFHVDRVHMVALGAQRGQYYRVIVGVQNLYDQSTRVDITLGGNAPQSPLRLDLKSLEAVRAVIDLPIKQTSPDLVMGLHYDVKVHGAGGVCLRESYRQRLSTRVADGEEPTLTADDRARMERYFGLPQLGGIQFFNADRKVIVQLRHEHPDPASCFSGKWQTISLGDEKQSSSVNWIRQEFLQVINASEYAYASKDAKPISMATMIPRDGTDPADSLKTPYPVPDLSWAMTPQTDPASPVVPVVSSPSTLAPMPPVSPPPVAPPMPAWSPLPAALPVPQQRSAAIRTVLPIVVGLIVASVSFFVLWNFLPGYPNSSSSGSSRANVPPPMPRQTPIPSPVLPPAPMPAPAPIAPSPTVSPMPSPLPVPQRPSISIDDALEQLNTQSYSFQTTLRIDGSDVTYQGQMYQHSLALFGTSNSAPALIFANFSDGRLMLTWQEKKQFKILPLDKAATEISPVDHQLVSYVQAVGLLRQFKPEHAVSRPGYDEYQKLEGVSVRVIELRLEDKSKVVTCTLAVDTESRLPVKLDLYVRTPPAASSPQTHVRISQCNPTPGVDANLLNAPIPDGFEVIDLTKAPSVPSVPVDPSTMSDLQKIHAALDQWNHKKKDKAVASLMAVNWSNPQAMEQLKSTFSPGADKPAEATPGVAQADADSVVLMAQQSQELSDYVVELSKTMESAGQVELIEKNLQNMQRYGQLLDTAGQPDVLRKSGMQIRIDAMTRLIEFYDNQNELEKKLMLTRRLAILRSQLPKSAQ